MNNTFISLITIILLFSCSNTIKSTGKGTTTDNSRFIVSFISIGGGPDMKNKKKYDAYITEFEQKNKIKLSYEITSWGKEGEFDYCFKLTELNKKKQEVFIAEIKEVLKNSSLIRFNENTPCRQKK